MGTRRTALALCAVFALTSIGGAATDGTPFEELAVEVDERRGELATPANRAERRQLRTLRGVTRVLLRVPRGLKRDLSSARRIAQRIDRRFPGDAEFGPLLDGMLDGFATDVSNRIFDAEQITGEAANAQRQATAEAFLGRARDFETLAASAGPRGQRARFLLRATRKVVAAERAIAFVPPDPIIPTGDPLSGVVGQFDYTINGATAGTVAVDATSWAGTLLLHLHVDAQPATQQLSDVTMDWTVRQIGFSPVALVSDADDTATIVITRGGTVYDRNTSGDIRIAGLKFSNAPVVVGEMTGTYRISAESAGGQKISLTGAFDLAQIPYSVDLGQP